MSTSLLDALDAARTFLFVPGHRPERFGKAVAADADVTVIDLEDAVPSDLKGEARTNVVTWLDEYPHAAHTIAVRINATDHPAHVADVEALRDKGVVLMLPKAHGKADFAWIAGSSPLIALIETAAGVLDASKIAATTPVRRLAIGTFDLAAELGIDPLDREALLFARSQLVLASAAAGLAGPIDGVFAAIDDPSGLAQETKAAKRLGFDGKLCIHPSQVDVVAAAIAPTADEVDAAIAIIDAAAAAGDGVVKIDGKMVDKPVLDRARRIVGGH